MTSTVSTSTAARRARGRRLVAVTLFAAAVAVGAASVPPAIAGAEPTVTPLPPKPPGLPDIGWDIEGYDSCMAIGGHTPYYCCVNTGGRWAAGKCTAPPAKNAQ